MRRDDLALDELAARARKGTHALLATRVLAAISTAVSIAILPRLIPPADFGIWAMATLAFGALTIVRQLGLVACIARAPSLTPREQDAYIWASIWLSLGTALVLSAAAPLLARFYGTPLLEPITWILAAVLVAEGLGFVQTAILRRELRYEKVAWIEGSGTLVTLCTVVTCALLWGDVWALLAGQVAYGVWTTIAAWLAYGRLPGRPVRGGKTIDLRFSVHLTSYNVVTYLANNIALVAGFRLGALHVGFLNRALQFFHITYTSLLVPVTDVALSLLCRLGNGEEYRRGYVAMAQRAWMLVLPLALVLPLISEDLMLCLLGAAWLPAAPLLAWFAPAIITRGFASLFAQLLTSQGRGTELHRWALVDLGLRAAGAFAGAPFGPAGIAAGFSLVGFLVTLPCMLWIAGRQGPVGWREQLDAARPAALVGLAAAAAAGAMFFATTRLGMHAGWTRFLLIGSAAATAAAMATLMILPARRALLGTGIAEALRGAR